MEKKDVVIIGAGASGLMCAIEAGKARVENFDVWRRHGVTTPTIRLKPN